MDDELRKAAQVALAAMEKEWDTKLSKGNAYSFMKAARALRAAIANNANVAPETQPVAWMGYSGVGEKIVSPKAIYSWMTIPLYTAPVPAPRREWVGLTVEERRELLTRHRDTAYLAIKVEAALKEKNT